MTQHRTFEHRHASRESVPLLVGIYGPSGSGKTYSALRLASGIRRVSGGKVFVIDTEARRSLHYAADFDFEHLQFDAPFGPLDYLAALQHCEKNGAKVVVIDSMSHEHEGPGGVLEMHEQQAEELSRKWNQSRDAVNFPAWAKPKSERRRLINSILQLQINLVSCFRAKEKTKPGPKGSRELMHLGFMPIAGEEYIYEQTLCALLEPGANGVPTWVGGKDAPGEQRMIKLPKQFQSLFANSRQFDEDMGEAMARWAAGTHGSNGASRFDELSKAIDAANTAAVLDLLIPQFEEAKKSRAITPAHLNALRAAWKERQSELQNSPPVDPETGEALAQEEPGASG